MIPDINLLPKYDKRQSTSKNLFIILTAVMLLLVIFFAFQYFQFRAEIAKLQDEEEQVIAERNRLQEELDNMTVNTGSLKQSVEYVERISYPVSPIIDETVRLQPEHSYLREYAFEEEAAEVAMDFETLSDISDYLTQLSNSPFFKDAQVTSIEQFELGGEEEEEREGDFHEIPRYEVRFKLYVDSNSLAAGGDED